MNIFEYYSYFMNKTIHGKVTVKPLLAHNTGLENGAKQSKDFTTIFYYYLTLPTMRVLV